MEHIPSTDELKEEGCLLSREEVCDLLKRSIGGTRILDRSEGDAFHARGAQDIKWFPNGKPGAHWTVADWTSAITNCVILIAQYEMAEAGVTGCTRAKEVTVSHKKITKVNTIDPETKYIVFGELHQVHKSPLIESSLDFDNVKFMKDFGRDLENPLTEDQKNMLTSALDWVGTSRAVCCCPGGNNRSALMKGLIEIKHHGNLSRVDPTNDLYRHILTEYDHHKDLEKALASAPGRKRRRS